MSDFASPNCREAVKEFPGYGKIRQQVEETPASCQVDLEDPENKDFRLKELWLFNPDDDSTIFAEVDASKTDVDSFA